MERARGFQSSIRQFARQLRALLGGLALPRVENSGELYLGPGVHLSPGVVAVELVIEPGGRLSIGAGAVLECGVSIGCHGRIDIGDGAILGRFVMVIDTGYHDLYDRDQVPRPEPIVIGAGVVIGAHSSVMPGVRIGRGARVWPGSVVTRDVPDFGSVRGVPAAPF